MIFYNKAPSDFSQTGERMMLYIRIRFVLLTKLNFMA